MNEAAALGSSQGDLRNPAWAPPPVSGPGGARIREATFADYHQVAAVQARNGLNTKSYGDWCALWSDNPAYLTASDPLPIGWVLEAKSGAIAGFLGNLPLAYRFRGRTLLAATAHSWVVDGGYRGYSIGLLDTFLKQASIDLYIFTTVNSAAEAALRAFRLSKVPVGRWDLARFWVSGYYGFVRSAMLARSIPSPGVWAVPLAGALWVRDQLWGPAVQERIRANGVDYQVELTTEFGPRFDDFWQTCELQNRERLLAVRDRETLGWHYRAAIARGNLWITAVSLRGRLVAYWVVDRQDLEELGLRRLRYVDFQALPGFEHLVRTAIAWTLEKCRNEKIHVADNPGCWLERYRIASATGPYRRQMKSWLFYYRARRGELAEKLRNPGVWTPSSYDGDASL